MFDPTAQVCERGAERSDIVGEFPGFKELVNYAKSSVLVTGLGNLVIWMRFERDLVRSLRGSSVVLLLEMLPHASANHVVWPGRSRLQTAKPAY
jgi:hypothetical protein